MSDDVLRGAFGRCDNVRKVVSRGVVQIIIEVPVECFSAAVRILDGKDVWVEEAPEQVKGVGRYWVIDGEPVIPGQKAKSAATPKPYGKEASELYKAGFWFTPAVLAAIGTDEEYRAWIQKQPCIVCGGGDYVEKTGELKCEAAHVKRPSNSGMGHKPDYSCVPLCHECHINVQHARGLPELYLKHCKRIGYRLKTRWNPFAEDAVVESEITANEARDWLDRTRDKLLIEWATSTIAAKFKVESTGFIPPAQLVAWARKHGIDEHLPETYRKVEA